MNQDLSKIRNWCFDNRLLNASKTKLMLFGSRQMIAKIPNFNLSLLGKDLVPTRCARDLGMTFDDHLTFSDHTVKTVSSCISSLTQINRTKHAFDKGLLMTIIKGLVFSKMFLLLIIIVQAVLAYGQILLLLISTSYRLFRTFLPA